MSLAHHGVPFLAGDGRCCCETSPAGGKPHTTAVVQANDDDTFVRIEVDRDGLHGTGECFFAPGLTAILGELAPLLIGRDPRQIQRLVQHLARKMSAAGSTAGILWNAITGIEAALHDLVGKRYGCPATV